MKIVSSNGYYTSVSSIGLVREVVPVEYKPKSLDQNSYKLPMLPGNSNTLQLDYYLKFRMGNKSKESRLLKQIPKVELHSLISDWFVKKVLSFSFNSCNIEDSIEGKFEITKDGKSVVYDLRTVSGSLLKDDLIKNVINSIMRTYISEANNFVIGLSLKLKLGRGMPFKGVPVRSYIPDDIFTVNNQVCVPNSIIENSIVPDGNDIDINSIQVNRENYQNIFRAFVLS